MKVALAQVDIAWQDRATNLRRAETFVREARTLGAELVVLPEMFACGFTMDTSCAEPVDGPTATWAARLATELDVNLVLGLPEQPATAAEDPPPHNVALLTRRDGTTARYAKTHLFSFSDEHRHYRAGDAVTVWEVGGLRICPLICYDLRFPEPFRLAAADVDAFLVIASWPERRAEHWRVLLRARAIEQQAWVLAVNRVGEGDGLRYRGDSAIIDPWGEVLVERAHVEGLLVADVDAERARSARQAFPPLRDRRTDLTRA